MMLGFRSSGSLVRRGLLMLALLMVGSVYAQDYAAMGISEVVSAADALLKQGNYSGAIPALEEVIVRTKELTSAQGHETLQTSRFQLARALYQIGNTKPGMVLLKEYLAEEPRSEERMALRMMAQGYLETEEWDEVISISRRLINMPKLPSEDLLIANLLLGQALFRQEAWEESIEPLSFAADKSKDAHTRQLTQIMIVRAMVESEQWNKLFGWIPRLYRTDAKYDITLNLTLMRAGKALFDAGEPDDYLNSLLLYRMVLPRKELLEFSQQRVDLLSASLTKDAARGVKEVDMEGRQKELEGLKASMAVLSGLPPYEDEVAFRIGQIYAEVKRYWEGYVLFDSLYEKDRNSDIGEASVLQSVLILYDVGEVERAEERVARYLDEKPDGQYARSLLSIAMRHNLMAQNLEKVSDLQRYIEPIPPSQEESELAVAAELHYMLAFGFFQGKQYDLAGEQFSVIIDSYPGSRSVADAIYFRGMTYMLQGEYESAMEDFLLYQQEHDTGEHYAPAMFREAVCLFGMGDIAASEIVFSRFIDTHPNNVLVSEAYSMRGDIEAAKDGNDNPDTPDVDEYDPRTLDRAVEDYRKGIAKSYVPPQAAYAAFQAAKVYKLEAKWQDIIDLMNYYMELLDKDADVAQAIFWIGQSQIEMGQLEEAVSAYLDSIERFGNEVGQEGVDKIVLELIKIADQYLSEEDRQGLAVKLALRLNRIEDDEDKVLKLRLRVAMAHLEGEEAAAALGGELLGEQQDLSITTPISLALMCDAAVMAGDAEQMGLLYTYFLENFEESDELWHAYRAKVFQLLLAEDYLAVLESIDEVQGLFGVESYMGWAQILRADTLYDDGDYGEAEEAYNMVMGVSDWRGALFAEAMYGMGRCRLAVEDYEVAHSFFQRTYLLFKGYEDGIWAAKGYLGAVDCLIQLDRIEDAVNTLDSMMEDPYVNTLPQIETARELKKKYGDA